METLKIISVEKSSLSWISLESDSRKTPTIPRI
jgi:hypothetical protein